MQKWSTDWLRSRTDKQLHVALEEALGNEMACAEGAAGARRGNMWKWTRRAEAVRAEADRRKAAQ